MPDTFWRSGGPERSAMGTYRREPTRTPSARTWRNKSGGGSNTPYTPTSWQCYKAGIGLESTGEEESGEVETDLEKKVKIKAKTTGQMWAQLKKTAQNHFDLRFTIFWVWNFHTQNMQFQLSSWILGHYFLCSITSWYFAFPLLFDHDHPGIQTHIKVLDCPL